VTAPAPDETERVTAARTLRTILSIAETSIFRGPYMSARRGHICSVLLARPYEVRF